MKTLIRLLTIVCIFLLASVKSEYKPCKLREYSDGYVCVCDETYCDTTDVKRPTKFGDYVIVTSSQTGKRFDVNKGRFKSKQQPSVFRVKREMNSAKWRPYSLKLTLDHDKQFQKIVGFGGAYFLFPS